MGFTDIFDELEPAERVRLLNQAVNRSFEPGAVIIDESKPITARVGSLAWCALMELTPNAHSVESRVRGTGEPSGRVKFRAPRAIWNWRAHNARFLRERSGSPFGV